MRPGLWTPAIVFLAFLALYGASLTNHLSEDSTGYACSALQYGKTSLHPHHLLYGGLLRLTARGAGGPEAPIERVLLSMQLLNALCSALAVMLFFLTCRRKAPGLQTALEIASRGYVFVHGRVELAGSSEELLKNPEIQKAYLGI